MSSIPWVVIDVNRQSAYLKLIDAQLYVKEANVSALKNETACKTGEAALG